MVLEPPSGWSAAAAVLHRASDPGSSRSALPSSPPCCLPMCVDHLASAFARLASALRALLPASVRLYATPRSAVRLPLLGDGARPAARHPSSGLCHANTDTRCDRPCGLPLWSCSLSMHGRRLATTTPQQQWRQYACSEYA